MTDYLFANGLDAATGQPLLQGATLDDIAERAAQPGYRCPADLYLQYKRTRGEKTRAPVEGIDPNDLAQAGWGVIFSAETPPEVLEALAPLLRRRKEDAGDRYYEFSGISGIDRGEDKRTFLTRMKRPLSGPVDPKKMPYYLLLVGDPQQIPFTVQYEFDVQHAVGRIHFDTVEEYARYGQAVVAAESGGVTVDARAAFVGTANPGDNATRASLDRLVIPLAKAIEDQNTWAVEQLLDEGAYKKHLTGLLARPKAPALLFTASHGACYPTGHEMQQRYQGALVMQDWDGPPGKGSPDLYFSADDVTPDLHVAGMFAFHFACFGAGVPDANNFFGYSKDAGNRLPVADQPFLSALPKKLLSSGALAVIGHIDLAFAASFQGVGSTAPFESLLKKIMSGGRIGFAMDYLNLRHAELSVGLTTVIDEQQRTNPEKRQDLARRWLENNDARNYVVIGDPAAKAPIARDAQTEKERITQRIAALESELADLKSQLERL